MIDMVDEEYSYESLSKLAEFISDNVPCKPDILIICGSGLGSLANTIKDPTTLNYKDIPNFPVSTIDGHAGKLVFGTLSNVRVVCMQGRFHYYEGYSLQKCIAPIKVFALIGVKILIVTNAAGAINQNYKVGDIMLIKDHINLMGFAGVNPLRGHNDNNFGPRFFPMNRAYNKTILTRARGISRKLNLDKNTHEGVYAMVGGPNYETIAEVNFLKTMGVDAIGMSTVPEVLAAKHCGMAVFGLSFITNVCVSSYDDEYEPNHEHVLDAVNNREEQLQEFITELVDSIRLDIY